MHPALLEAESRVRARCQQDDRCLAYYMIGSDGAGTADEWSDLDLAIMTTDASYEAYIGELRGLVEECFGPIVAWLTEGPTDFGCNYAFLFRHAEELLLTDLYVGREGAPYTPRPTAIIFDRIGRLLAQLEEAPPSPAAPANLEWTLVNWWVYCYLNGKYWKRGDLWKLLYVQQVLFSTHFQVLKALYPDKQWVWPARDLHQLPPEQEQRYLAYYPAASFEAISAALLAEMDLFSEDARAASAKHGLPYPVEMEEAVRKHLDRMVLSD
jgi:hypothetical protein